MGGTMIEAWWLVVAGGVGVAAGMFLFAVMSMAAHPDDGAESQPVNHLLT
jgi:hypothetical protein